LDWCQGESSLLYVDGSWDILLGSGWRGWDGVGEHLGSTGKDHFWGAPCKAKSLT